MELLTITSGNGSIILTYRDRVVDIKVLTIEDFVHTGHIVEIIRRYPNPEDRPGYQTDVIAIDYRNVTSPVYTSGADLKAALDAMYVAQAILITGGSGTAPGSGDSTTSSIVASANYTSPDDFTATFVSSTTISLSALPFIPTAEQIKYVFVKPLTGEATWFYNGVDGIYFDISSNILTINGATTPFTTGDIYEVGILGQRKPYDPSTQSDKISVLNTEYFHNKSNPNWSETLSATAKSYYVVPMANYKGGSITFRGTMGAGSSGVLKSYLTNDVDEDTSTITIANWHDDSTDLLGAASVTLPAATTTDQVIHMDTNYGCQYLLLEVDYTHAANSTITINSYIN